MKTWVRLQDVGAHQPTLPFNDLLVTIEVAAFLPDILLCPTIVAL